MKPADLKRAISAFIELAPFSQQLLRGYRVKKEIIDLTLYDGQVFLQVLIGDVLDTLPKLKCMADCWFLDGFAPSKNPQMWQPWMFQIMAEKSKYNASYATFTAARVVREALYNAGFSTNKLPGFGSKRDMIAGSLIKHKKRST